MAKIFKAPFQIGNNYHYVELKVPKVDSSVGNNIICCVDVSGSMSGSPIKGVCDVLRDIYRRTNVEYPLFTYNTRANTNLTIKSVENRDLDAGGGTSFSSIFTAIQNHLMNNQKSTTFIFMTDGQDTDSQTTLKQSMKLLKFTMSGLPKTISVTVHVIGFGEVNNKFLEEVRLIGNKAGLFRYSTRSAELQNDFNDMFEYSISSREFTLIINGESFTSTSNEDTVSFLIENMNIDRSTVNEVTLKSDIGESKFPLEFIEDPSALQIVRALNLITPEDPEQVQAVRLFLNTIVPRSGTDFMEKIEFDQLKKEIDDRMVEYKKLLGQLKMGQVPEQVKLKLSALRHDATFANAHRRKVLDLRVSKNVDYFRTTDISGILEGYKTSISQDVWNEIKQQKQNWVCSYSNDDIYELMRKAPDNVLCLGIFIERSEEAITSPTKGLKLVSVSSTLISFDSFIIAMNHAKNAQLQNGSTENYGKFDQINENFCFVGQAREKINAVIPLYINFEHMKRIRILEGILLGHLFTLDSYGYDKRQEIGLLKLLFDLIMKHDGTTRNKQFIEEFEKVCHFIITESVGFESAYGKSTYENFLASIHGRQNGTYDLSIPLMIGYLRKDLRSALVPIYYEHLRRIIQKEKKIDRTELLNRLLYGDESKIVKTVASNENRNILDLNDQDADYVERSFIDFFHDELKKPIELVSETVTGEERKLISQETEVDFIKSFLESLDTKKYLAVPPLINDLLKFTGSNEISIENQIDFDDLRKELVLILAYDSVVPTNVNKNNIFDIVDQRLQGAGQENVWLNSLNQEQIRILSYKILTAKTLEGFGGLMRKYCPRRCGPLFIKVVQSLITSTSADSTSETIKPVLVKEKLVSLLTNEIGYSSLYKNEIGKFVWQPLKDVDIDILASVVGPDELKSIEAKHRGKPVLHCYRLSNKPNRAGHSNYNPNLNYKFSFSSYQCRF